MTTIVPLHIPRNNIIWADSFSRVLQLLTEQCFPVCTLVRTASQYRHSLIFLLNTHLAQNPFDPRTRAMDLIPWAQMAVII